MVTGLSRHVAFVVGALSLFPGASPASLSPADPFAFLGPTIQLQDQDRRRMDQRGIVLRILPAKGHELAVLAGGDLRVGSDALVASLSNIADLKRSSYVPQIGRFSPEPRIEDLRELTLDDSDVDDIRSCRPGRCKLNLTPDEIALLQQTISSGPAKSTAPLDAAFRRVVLERAKQYLRSGDDGPGTEFPMLLRNSPYLESRAPQLSAYLERYPAVSLPESESFLYWSKETYAWKPMISVTHMTIVRGPGESGIPEVIAAARDVFATRYTSGSLVLTLLFRDPDDGNRRYLVYINRTCVNDVRPWWRPFVEFRIKRSAKRVFTAIRDRIERPQSAKP
jgi:hypothetical protein